MKKITMYFLSMFLISLVYGQEQPIQERVEAALEQSFATQSNQIEPIITELMQGESANEYWIAYAQFYQSIYHLHSGTQDKAKAILTDAIERLEGIKDKSSEEHALLGYCLGYSISFEPNSAVRLSTKAVAQYNAALKKNKNNLRAYLGLGESDFHKPTAYGGGEKVEEYLLKAISLPDQIVDNGPSWGKNMAYYTLASFYLREGKTDEARMYCMQGLEKYPHDHQLNQLKQSF